MVPKIAGKGASFKGAGLYYLHDKGAATAERVAFTHTENLPTDNPEMALKIMAFTAMHQAQIKAANGAVKTGRKLAQAVYAYSLSWHPDERPDRQDMLEAARQTIEALGLAGHEAVFVSHNDEKHPHIHVIVNRVNPQTGIAAKLSNDRLILSRWAEEYERQHGKIRCEERVQNNAERSARKQRGESGFVKHRPALTAAEVHAARKAHVAAAFERRQIEARNLAAKHKGERRFLYDEKERRIATAREGIREENRPKWAALYRRQREEFGQMEAAQASFLSRFVFWLRNRDLRGQQGFTGALAALVNRAQFGKELTVRHERERKALVRAVRVQTAEAVKSENQAYRHELDRLKGRQGEETAALRTTHSKESQDLARAIKEGRPLGIGKVRAAGPMEPAPVPVPPAPGLALSPPAGPPEASRRRLALYEQMEQRLARRMESIRAQARPVWSAMFRSHREQLKTAPRRNHAALQAAHGQEREALAARLREERQRATAQEKAALERDLAIFDKELGREAAAYRKAAQAGEAKAPALPAKSPLVSDEFRARVGRRIRKERERGGRGEGRGRERDRE